MSYSSRPRGHHHRGGPRGASQDLSKKRQIIAVQGPGIFASESPKAYCPLGYGHFDTPRTLKPEDFTNDASLPLCPSRLPQYISKPLGCTFLDTEAERSDFKSGQRHLLNRNNASEDGDGIADPSRSLVEKNRAKKTPLMLGKNVISEDSLISGGGFLENMLKRNRETTVEPEDKSAKKQRRDFTIKLDGEEVGVINENTVRPENVLRMVDQSLVENTPERRARQEEEMREENMRKAAMSNVTSRPPVQPRFDDPYYDRAYRERDDRDRERYRDREHDAERERGYRARESYKYPPRDYGISSSNGRSYAPSLPPAPRQAAYQEDYRVQSHGRSMSSAGYYDRHYEDKMSSRPATAGYPADRRPPSTQNDYNYPPALPPHPPMSPIRQDYRSYEQRGHTRSQSTSSRRYDDYQRYEERH